MALLGSLDLVFSAVGLNQVTDAIGRLKNVATTVFDQLVGSNIRLQGQFISMQSTIAGTNDVYQGLFRENEPLNKINALRTAVGDMLKDIRQGSLDIAGVTSDQLVELAQFTAADISKLGGDLKDAAKLALDYGAAMGTLQIPLQGARQEITSLAQAQINADSAIAKSLGITSAMMRQHIAAGDAVEFLHKKMEAFRKGNELQAQTWTGLVSNIQEFFDEIKRQIGEPLLSELLKQLSSAYDFIKKNQASLINSVKEIFEGMGAGIAPFLSLLKDLAKEAGPLIVALLRDMGMASKDFGELFGAILSTTVIPLLQSLIPVLHEITQVLQSDFGKIIVQGGLVALMLNSTLIPAFVAASGAAQVLGLRMIAAVSSLKLIPLSAAGAISSLRALTLTTFTATAGIFAFIAALGAIPVIMVKTTKDLEEANDAIEVFNKTLNTDTDSSVGIVKKIRELNNLEKESGQLTEEQFKKREGYIKIAQQSIASYQQRIDEIKAAKGRTGDENLRALFDTQISEYEKLISLLSPTKIMPQFMAQLDQAIAAADQKLALYKTKWEKTQAEQTAILKAEAFKQQMTEEEFQGASLQLAHQQMEQELALKQEELATIEKLVSAEQVNELRSLRRQLLEKKITQEEYTKALSKNSLEGVEEQEKKINQVYADAANLRVKIIQNEQEQIENTYSRQIKFIEQKGQLEALAAQQETRRGQIQSQLMGLELDSMRAKQNLQQAIDAQGQAEIQRELNLSQNVAQRNALERQLYEERFRNLERSQQMERQTLEITQKQAALQAQQNISQAIQEQSKSQLEAQKTAIELEKIQQRMWSNYVERVREDARLKGMGFDPGITDAQRKIIESQRMLNKQDADTMTEGAKQEIRFLQQKLTLEARASDSSKQGVDLAQQQYSILLQSQGLEAQAMAKRQESQRFEMNSAEIVRQKQYLEAKVSNEIEQQNKLYSQQVDKLQAAQRIEEQRVSIDTARAQQEQKRLEFEQKGYEIQKQNLDAAAGIVKSLTYDYFLPPARRRELESFLQRMGLDASAKISDVAKKRWELEQKALDAKLKSQQLQLRMEEMSLKISKAKLDNELAIARIQLQQQAKQLQLSAPNIIRNALRTDSKGDVMQMYGAQGVAAAQGNTMLPPSLTLAPGLSAAGIGANSGSEMLGGNATFGETGSAQGRNAAGWVHGHFQNASRDQAELIRDTLGVVRKLLDQGVHVVIRENDIPKNISDAKLQQILASSIEEHQHRSRRSYGIDVSVPTGTKVPIPLEDVRQTPSKAEGINGLIPGTNTFIGHLAQGSQSGGGYPRGNRVQAPGATRGAIKDRRVAVVQAAQQLGMSPMELGALLAQESSFNPNKWGGTGNDYFGLIQFGRNERKDFNINPNKPQDFREQLFGPVMGFLRQRGYKYGSGVAGAYDKINPGGEAYLKNMMPGGQKYQEAMDFFGGKSGLAEAQQMANNSSFPAGQFKNQSSGEASFVKMTDTGKTNAEGQKMFSVQVIKGGKPIFTEIAYSGLPGKNQKLTTGENSAEGKGKYPIPEGKYGVGKLEEGNFGDVGSLWMGLKNKSSNERDSFGFHLDADGILGSHGCIVFKDPQTVRNLAKAVENAGAENLYVDYGKGSVKVPKPSSSGSLAQMSSLSLTAPPGLNAPITDIADPDAVFNGTLNYGYIAFREKAYVEAAKQFTLALNLKPGDSRAQKALANTMKMIQRSSSVKPTNNGLPILSAGTPIVADPPVNVVAPEAGTPPVVTAQVQTPNVQIDQTTEKVQNQGLTEQRNLILEIDRALAEIAAKQKSAVGDQVEILKVNQNVLENLKTSVEQQILNADALDAQSAAQTEINSLARENLEMSQQAAQLEADRARLSLDISQSAEKSNAWRDEPFKLFGLNITDLGSVIDAAKQSFSGFFTAIQEDVTNIGAAFGQMAISFLDSLNKMVIAALTNMVFQQILGLILPGGGGGFGFSSGGAGQMGSNFLGSILGGTSITGFADGGIVTKPTFSLIGEGRHNEAVVPLPNGRSIPVSFNGGSGGAGGSSSYTGPTASVNVTVNNPAGKEFSNREGDSFGREIEQAVTEVIRKSQRAGGLLDKTG